MNFFRMRGINTLPAIKSEIIKIYNKTKNFRETAKLTAIPYSTVRRIIKKQSVHILSKKTGG